MPISTYGADYFAAVFTTLDLYLALCSVTPAPGDNGSTIMEIDAVAGVDYSRLLVDSVNWTATTNGRAMYGIALAHSPTVYWGSINSWALLDTSAVGTGNMYAYGNITPQIYAAAGSFIELPVGSITIGVEI